MKKCLKSRLEPESLSIFRDNFPAGRWEQFREQDPDGYTSVRDSTRADQSCLCAYCETRLERNNEQIAHFHPKSDTSGSHNWALDWTNLWLACKGGSQTWLPDPHDYLPPLPDNLSCDEYKGNKILDGCVLAPYELPAFPRVFQFRQQPDAIEICADEDGCKAAGVDISRVAETIKEFNLNCARLAAARLRVHQSLERAKKKLRESGRDEQTGMRLLAQKHLAKDADGRWPQFFTLIRWCLRKEAEAYLESIAYEG